MGNNHSGFKDMQRFAPGLSLILTGALMMVPRLSDGDSYGQEWGPPVGSQVPVLAATDQSGTARTLDNLAGEHGLLLFMVRSADW